MKTRLLLLAAILILNSCFLFAGNSFSEWEKDKKAGNNLSFEFSKNGLAQNWYFKTPKVINNRSRSGKVVDFDLVIDTLDAKEGKQSLKYVVRHCEADKEHMKEHAYYPGFFKEIDVTPGANYVIKFWVKNKGTQFEIRTSAVKEMGGKPCPVQAFKGVENFTQWTPITLQQRICDDMKFLRIEVDVQSEGVFQIDAISITKLP